MLVTRLFLRNYRVYEEPLDLEIPPGLVGIFGPNGAGKSYLCESLLFALWGRTRTSIADVRTTGVGGDCVAEVQFEHEGHLYTVRRTISGVNSSVKASAFADGNQMAEGVRDTSRYVHSILGMDDAAFRSSVFAEQKQLAAFSQQRPQQRRDLVLKLLGVMPLDTARDEARRDARNSRERLEQLKAMLPDLDELRDVRDDSLAAAEAADREAVTEAEVAAAARSRLAAAQGRLEELETLRHRHEQVVAEGQAVKAEHAHLARRVEELKAELTGLSSTSERIAELAARARGLEAAEAELVLVQAAATAHAAVEKAPVPAPGDAPDEEGCEAARAEAEALAKTMSGLDGELVAARAELARAREAAGRSAVLGDEAHCPLCGQSLGGAFEQVQAHRAAEVAQGEARVEALVARRLDLEPAVASASARAEAEARRLKDARQAWVLVERARARREDAEAALAQAEKALGRGFVPGEAARLVAQVDQQREAAREVARLHALLERRPVLEAQHEVEADRMADAARRLEELRERVRSLGFRGEELQRAREERDTAGQRAEAAAKCSNDARVVAERARVTAEAAQRRLADAESQHARLGELIEESRHLGRLADLLSAFRNGVVATVGPRLAAQAAELFAELTDHEYDRLELDPETYEIQIRDKGRLHGMQRFSGSETDLANLAVRVAISEHVRLLSGGSVGLLVLDEVFGPLDEDRKARMLSALERLKGRFRQVLVVTHDDSIKAELPHAIEVMKLPGRRASARVVNG